MEDPCFRVLSYYKWWRTRPVPKAHIWFRTYQDFQEETLSSFAYTAQSKFQKLKKDKKQTHQDDLLHRKKDTTDAPFASSKGSAVPLTKAGLRTQKVCSSSSPRKARFVSQFIPWTCSFRFAKLILKATGLAVYTSNALISAQASQHASSLVGSPAVQVIARGRVYKENSKTMSRTPLQLYSHKQTRNYELLSMFFVV